MNIYERMSKATQEIGTVEKKLKIQVNQSSSYKAVSERDVLDAVKEVEENNGIFSYPVSRKVVSQEMPVTTSEYQGKVTTKWSVFMRIETTFRFVNIEDPKDFLEVISYGDGVDSQDKAPGKAMTYSDKYALLKAYKIETGDDPDKDPSKTKEKTETKTEPPKQPTKTDDTLYVTEAQFGQLMKLDSSKALTDGINGYKEQGAQFRSAHTSALNARWKILKQGE
jgi:hypothetical protein